MEKVVRTGFHRGLWLFLFVPLISNAAPLASPDEDRRAKQAVPPAGKALIYIYRTDGGAKVSPTLRLNNREIGALQPRTYFMTSVSPGRVDIRADDETLSIRAQDGRIYFVHLAVTGSGEGKLSQVSYGRGRQEVHVGRLVREGQPAAMARRETVRESPDSPPVGSGGFNLIVKGGGFSLASGSQPILGIPLEITTGSSAFGFEGEWITASGWAFGAEYFGHTHSFTSTGGDGEIAVANIMLNVKKYFRYGATVQPYVGLGLGSAVAEITGGGITGGAGGGAVQAMTGLAFRWGHFGVYTEVKYQSAKTKDTAGESLDVGGTGLFAGVSAQF
jgi:Protein of unknown function (DUF2846)